MENQDLKSDLTPERLLSESDEDQPCIPSNNMSRIANTPATVASKRKETDPLSTLAINLENSSILKDGFDLEELRRKQEDLLLIQQMVQKNIEGIQKQIEKCSQSRDSMSRVGGTIAPKFYKKYAESDNERSPHDKLKTFERKRELSKSFTRSQEGASNRASFIKLQNKKLAPKSKINIESTDEEAPTRAKSSMLVRRNRGDRKKSVQSNGIKKVSKYSNRSAFKKKPSSVFSIHSGTESMKLLTDVTTSETCNQNGLHKAQVSKLDISAYSNNHGSTFSSNTALSTLIQLKNCCKKFTAKHIYDLAKVNPTLPTIRVMFAVIKIMQSMGEKVKKPTDWNGILKILIKKDKKLLQCIHNIPEKLELISAERGDLMKYKTQCFGKARISLTTISSSFQRECRIFANLLALVVLMLQKMKKEQLDITQTTVKADISMIKNEETSNFNETEGPFPKESCDESTGYYNDAKYIPFSKELTPDQPKVKKSPVKKNPKSPGKAYVKRGYLSSDNQSTGSHNNMVNDYVSPIKSSQIKPKFKKNSSTMKKSVHLYNKKEQRGEKSYLNKFSSPVKLSSSSAQSIRGGINSDSENKRSKRNSKSPRIVKSKTSGTLRGSLDKGILSAPEGLKRERKPSVPSANKTKRKKKPKPKPKNHNPYETTDESEDPLDELVKLEPRLKAYDKEKDGGLLYAFLELKQCPKPLNKLPIPIEKAESYNPSAENAEIYKNSIVSTSLTGFARQSSENMANSMNRRSVLSDEDYKKILELKNQRMKTLLEQSGG
ncbi:unnamed protein product [Moneuplotes crassus]|uniref:Uncharacterized protein n=1 Tax=Euplotes crassus TaxID=5936 RepID=A0AAD1Y8Z5_EUPCR|nr:unnamed protein product [Moneuplotes crassus]